MKSLFVGFFFLAFLFSFVVCQEQATQKEQRFFCVSLGRLCGTQDFSEENSFFCDGFAEKCPDPAETACCIEKYQNLSTEQIAFLISTVPLKDKNSYSRVFDSWN